MSRESDILKLREQYKNLFKKYIRKYYNYGFDLDDIKAEMDIALIKAYDHYDASRNVDFGLCLSFWVRDALIRYSIKNRKIISPNCAFVVSKKDIAEIKDWRKSEFVAETEAYTIKDDNTDLERRVYEKEILNKIPKFLTTQQNEVIKGRLKGETLAILANRLNLSRERIRQVELAALKSLQNKKDMIY